MTALSAPELRRRKAERVDEFKRLSAECARDGAAPTPEQATQLNTMFAEIEVGGSLDRQIENAEKFAAAEGIAARDRLPKGNGVAPLAHEDPANTGNGKHQYSMLKAIREAAGLGDKSNSFGQAGLTGVEAEVDADLRARRGPDSRRPRGIMVPNNLPVNQYAAARWAALSGMTIGGEAFAYNPSDPTVESTISGVGAIPTILGDMISVLRARMVTVSMGARVMENMQGLFALPRQTAATAAYWVTEGQDVTQSATPLDQVTFAPHTVGVRTPYTRRFLEQTTVSAESFIREDQAAVLARAIESAALNGSGSAGQPSGLIQNGLINIVSAGTNGGAPAWTNLVGLETAVATANADMGSLGYVIDAAVRGTLKNTPKIGSTFPVFLWDDGTVNGYPVGVTNLLPSNLTKGTGTGLHAAIFGNWNDLIYVYWSGLDVIVNPYSGDASGTVIITSFQDVDINVRHPQSFSKMLDLIAT